MTKTAINTRTQEEYHALMRYYKSQGIDYSEPEREGEKIWEIDKEQTCISVWIDGSLAHGSVAYYKSKHTPIIPYTEFAKANLTPEIDYKAKYEEVVELLGEVLESRKFYRDSYMNATDFEEDKKEIDEVGNRAQQFLTNHKDGE